MGVTTANALTRAMPAPESSAPMTTKTPCHVPMRPPCVMIMRAGTMRWVKAISMLMVVTTAHVELMEEDAPGSSA